MICPPVILCPRPYTDHKHLQKYNTAIGSTYTTTISLKLPMSPCLNREPPYLLCVPLHHATSFATLFPLLPQHTLPLNTTSSPRPHASQHVSPFHPIFPPQHDLFTLHSPSLLSNTSLPHPIFPFLSQYHPSSYIAFLF